MMARSFGSFCSLLLVWLCALGAAPVRHPVARAVVARGATELALRDAADVPLVATRAVIAHNSAARPVERDAASPPSWLGAPRVSPAPSGRRDAHATLDRQATAHASRPRWRAYDAAAPPALSRSAR